MAQLLRATTTDYDPDAQRLVLLDAKGRRQQPRRHEIALGSRAAVILDRLSGVAAKRLDGRLFGRTVPDSGGDVVAAISAAMVEAGEARGPFAFRDMRRTVETLMAEQLRVSKDIRARIQSHGLGGVQDRHYDRADYGAQIRAALTKWESWLIDGPKKGTVQRLRRVA